MIDIKLKKANKRLDAQDFNEIMYAYRCADMMNQASVLRRFAEVKEWIKNNYKS